MKRFWLWVLLAAVLAGCGGSVKGAKSAPSGGAAPGTYAEGAGAPAAEMAPPATSSASDAPSGGFQAPEPAAPSATTAPRTAEAERSRERPGLGTEWGEQLSSHVHDVAFERANGDHPFAMATLFYNDRAGVEAMASYRASRGARFREASAAGGAITVSIHDGTGEPLEAMNVGDRTYVIGQAGDRYTIVLTNHTNHRFEAVGTVDGLDVINGQPGSMQNRGYLLMPFATLEIEGFRQSQDAVAAFRFSKVSDSYAAQMGKARNIGVIGVAFFSEMGDDFSPWTRDELERRDTANPFPGSDLRFARPPRR